MDLVVNGWKWLVAQVDSIGVGVITTALITITLIVWKLLYTFVNKLRPLSLTEYKLLNGVRVFMPPVEISVTTYNAVVAGTYAPDETETANCLKAITKLKRKGAIKAGDNGNNPIVEESYVITKYGRKRLKRYETIMRIKQILKWQNIKKTWASVKNDANPK